MSSNVITHDMKIGEGVQNEINWICKGVDECF